MKSDAYQDRCPVCKSTDFDVDNIDIKGDLKYESCYCVQCDADFEQVWAFVKYQKVVDKRS